jgi:hypothetical protein
VTSNRSHGLFANVWVAQQLSDAVMPQIVKS